MTRGEKIALYVALLAFAFGARTFRGTFRTVLQRLAFDLDVRPPADGDTAEDVLKPILRRLEDLGV